MNEQEHGRQVIRHGNIRVEQGRGYQNVSINVDIPGNRPAAQNNIPSTQSGRLDNSSAQKLMDFAFSKFIAIPFTGVLIAVFLTLLIAGGYIESFLLLIPAILYLAGFTGYKIFIKKHLAVFPSLDRDIAIILKERSGIITPSDLTSRVGIPFNKARNKLDQLTKEGYLYMEFDKNGSIYYRSSDVVQ